MLGCALARKRQDEFDAAHPYTPGVRRWVAERVERQRAGLLPPGDVHTRPAYLQPYIDDGGGAALNDRVPVPPELADALQAEARGGEHEGTRFDLARGARDLCKLVSRCGVPLLCDWSAAEDETRAGLKEHSASSSSARLRRFCSSLAALSFS